MPTVIRSCWLILLLFACPAASFAAEGRAGVPWIGDEHAAFERANREQRFVLLYLEAVWCHWCHVMDHDTYGDPDVQAAITAHYVPLRIDQDARPDLANRYREFGWPATIVFAADGSEIVKRRGFISPQGMRRLLATIVADPSPEHAAMVDTRAPAVVGGLADAVRQALLTRHRENYDQRLGGLATAQKYLERDSVEFALVLGQSGDRREATRARQTLDAARALIDPVWGGVYQYSTHSDWQHPHYEKLGTLQGEYLRAYATACGMTGVSTDCEAAAAIRRYVENFLSDPDGAFFASQDADPRPGEHGGDYFALDDAQRRARGMPRIDRHRYARETAAIAEGLIALYEATGDRSALSRAQRALHWLRSERGLSGGGFRHDTHDRAGPYLADSLAAGRAFLAMYRVTGEREWFTIAASAADFIEAQFRIASGYAGAARTGAPIAPVPQIDESISLGRFANLLSRYSGRAAHRDMAKHALAWLADPVIALSRSTEAGILLLDHELSTDPLHLTVIGGKDDPAARRLFEACVRVASTYKRLDWWDRAAGPLPNSDVNYPTLERAAAFVCTEQRCSTPIVNPDDVAAFIAESRLAAEG
jgi:hypothetical protein